MVCKVVGRVLLVVLADGVVAKRKECIALLPAPGSPSNTLGEPVDWHDVGDHHIDVADVDPKLERRRCRNCHQPASLELLLHFLSCRRRKPGPVHPDADALPGCIKGHQLRAQM